SLKAILGPKVAIKVDMDRHPPSLSRPRETVFVQCFAYLPAQAHDRVATQQNVKAKLALQLFQRGRRRFAQDEFRFEPFLQASRQGFGGKLCALFMRRTHRNQYRVLEGREIAAFAKFEFLLKITGEIVVPRKLNGRTERRVGLHKYFPRRFAAASTAGHLGEQLKRSLACAEVRQMQREIRVDD